MQLKFERAWRMRPGEFKFEVASNSLLLTREMHARFKNYDWALVPTKEVLWKIIRFVGRRDGKATHYLEEFPNQMWDYHFVRFRQPTIAAPQPTDDQLPEFAQSTTGESLSVQAGKEDGPSASDQLIADIPAFQVDKYPSEDIGLIQCHVHPFFVVYNAGEKMARIEISKDPRFHPSHRVKKCKDELWLCIVPYLPWVNTRPAALRSHTTPQPPNPSYPPGASRTHPDEWSERQQSDRDARAAKRQRRFSGHHPSPSGSGTTDSYLSTPEQSVHPGFADCEHGLGINSSGIDLATHWIDVEGWVEGVKSAAPAEDPYTGGTEQAKQSLDKYRSEMAQPPPRGSWERWVPEYECV
ncbi:unnamed protein product [Rhizoctonia solani]|uniref:Uncharacterized protein n=1 Tax=Rhizoctonia solani TaxID=456999 RepID=A0A8H3HZJ2_9AGAM|nr:unnamed protein product [Rhizoctonia solani]